MCSWQVGLVGWMSLLVGCLIDVGCLGLLVGRYTKDIQRHVSCLCVFFSCIHFISMWVALPSHILPVRSEARARRCYSKAGFKFESSSVARWGSKGHAGSEWQRWRKVLKTVLIPWHFFTLVMQFDIFCIIVVIMSWVEYICFSFYPCLSN